MSLSQEERALATSSQTSVEPSARTAGVALVLRLPSDVFLHVCTYLSTHDLLCGVALSNSEWHDLLLACEARCLARSSLVHHRGTHRSVRVPRTETDRLSRRPLPPRAVRQYVRDGSQQFWRTRWAQDVATGGACFLHHVRSLHHDSRTGREACDASLASPAEQAQRSCTTRATSITEREDKEARAPVVRLSIPFVATSEADSGADAKSQHCPSEECVAQLASLQLRIRPLILACPLDPLHAPPCPSDITFHHTEQLLTHVEQRNVRRALADVSPPLASDSARPPEPCGRPSQESDRTVCVLTANAKAETALLCRKALLFGERRAPRKISGPSALIAALAAAVDGFRAFETVTFSAETYPPTKTYANEEALLIDARRLCATVQYAIDCAYHQNFVAPHSLPCLRGEVGDSTTVDTPDEPLAQDIGGDLVLRGSVVVTAPPPAATTTTALETTAAAMTSRGGWVGATGGSPIGPDLLAVNVMWTPQRKTELYAGVVEGFSDPPRGLGAFFPIALTPAALTLYEARRAADLACQRERTVAAANALPVPDHFPTLPTSSEDAKTASPASPPPATVHGAGQVWLESPARPESPSLSTAMPFLFAEAHVITYLFLLQHISFSDVKHHFWEPDEHKYAICSRLISPTADSVECRFFYSYYVGSFPRLHMKMVFTQGDLPRTLINRKLDSPQVPLPLRRRCRDTRAMAGRSRRQSGVLDRHSSGSSEGTHSSSAMSEGSTWTSSSSSCAASADSAQASAEEQTTGQKRRQSSGSVESVESIVFTEEPDGRGPGAAQPEPLPPREPLIVPSAAGAGLSGARRLLETRQSASLSLPSDSPFQAETAHPEHTNEGGAIHEQLNVQQQREEDETGDDEDELPRHDPETFNEMYTLFVGGFGRVEVDVTPTVSKEGFVALRDALGLPETFPISWLWNIVVCASGLGARMMHRHLSGFLCQYHRTFTDAMESAFGGRACYGDFYPWLQGVVDPERSAASPPSTATAAGAVNVVVTSTPSSRADRSFSTSEAATSTTTFDNLDEPTFERAGTDRLGGRRDPFRAPPPFDSDDDSSDFRNAGHANSASFRSNGSGTWSAVSGGSWE